MESRMESRMHMIQVGSNGCIKIDLVWDKLDHCTEHRIHMSCIFYEETKCKNKSLFTNKASGKLSYLSKCLDELHMSLYYLVPRHFPFPCPCVH